MTTVGYGDLTPLGSLPRGLVVFEALLGQIFLVAGRGASGLALQAAARDIWEMGSESPAACPRRPSTPAER